MSQLEKYKDNWLPHLKESIPETAQGNLSTAYAIALEGWRRGLELKFVNTNEFKLATDFILSDGQDINRFSSSRGNKVPRETVNLCFDKYKTKEYLKDNGVYVLEHKLFEHNASDSEILHYVNKFGYPVVIKPYNSIGGEGVVLDIQTKRELRKALIYVRRKLGLRKIIIERHLSNTIDYQLYLINNKVVSSIQRMKPFVIGDGNSTIRSLINRLNRERKNNPGRSHHMIKVNKHRVRQVLKEQSYKLNSIPEEGEKVLLNKKRNVTIGGSTSEVTEKVSGYIKEHAIKAFKAIPNLSIGSVEIIYDKDKQMPYISEIKTKPTLTPFLFPESGVAKDIPKLIIDHYFPKSQRLVNSDRYYFLMDDIVEYFGENVIDEYTVRRLKTNDVMSKKVIISHTYKRRNIVHKLKKILIELKCNGKIYARRNRISIIIAGQKKQLYAFLKRIERIKRKTKKLRWYKTSNWNNPVNIGIEVIENTGAGERNQKMNNQSNEKIKKPLFKKLLQVFNI